MKAITAAELKKIMGPHKKRGLYRGNAGKKKRDDGYDSQLEADYAEHLMHLRISCVIDNFVYHPFRMKIAGGAYYTPDFLVARTIGNPGQKRWDTIEIHEVKGFWREAAAVRVKVAADKFPWFRFRVISRAKKTDPWKFEEVGR